MTKRAVLSSAIAFGSLILLAGCAYTPFEKEEKNPGKSAETQALDAKLDRAYLRPGESYAHPLRLSDEAYTGGTQTDFQRMAGETIYFDTASAELKPAAKATLDRQVRWLKKNPRAGLELVGHADSRGNAAFNRKLGEDRSKAVRAYLVSMGIDKERLYLDSRGEADASGADEYDRRVASHLRALR